MEAFAWPGAAVVLGLGAIIVFRHQFAALIARTKRVGKIGLETYDNPQTPAPIKKADPLAEFMGSYDNALLRDQESAIERDLERLSLIDPTDAREALIRALAGVQILAAFERVQSMIWASQIELLTLLNARPMALNEAEVKPFYDRASELYPLLYRHHSFEGWLSFLQSHLLIERQNDTLAITRFGREYLKWRIDAARAGPFHG